MPSVHRLADANSKHPCPPYAPAGVGDSSVCAVGYPLVLTNGMPTAVMGSITSVHLCVNPDEPPGPHVGIYVAVRKVLAGGMPVQAVADVNSCCAILATGSPTVIVGG